jgi:hypothetical protein
MHTFNAVLVEDGDGGRVFVFGVLSYVWDPGDEVGRRLQHTIGPSSTS